MGEFSFRVGMFSAVPPLGEKDDTAQTHSVNNSSVVSKHYAKLNEIRSRHAQLVAVSKPGQNAKQRRAERRQKQRLLEQGLWDSFTELYCDTLHGFKRQI